VKTFQEWLENKSPIIFSGFFGDGRIIVYINGKEYVYHMDSVYHYQIRKIAKYKPGEALNIIKKMVKDGRATLEKDDQEELPF
jgi:hypothetical protein